METKKTEDKATIKLEMLELVNAIWKELKESYHKVSESESLILELDEYFKNLIEEIRHDKYKHIVLMSTSFKEHLNGHLSDYKMKDKYANEMDRLTQLMKQYNKYAFHKSQSLIWHDNPLKIIKKDMPLKSSAELEKNIHKNSDSLYRRASFIWDRSLTTKKQKEVVSSDDLPEEKCLSINKPVL